LIIVAKQQPPVEKLSFEEAMRELDKIVRRLEADDLSLDESIAMFERGQALAARCTALLDAADLKVKQLLPGGELADFDLT
jgi:exodeoxyribonuclease VII small subunit